MGDDAGSTHNRRACSALQGLGGRATNKHMRLWLPKTLLAGTWYNAYVSSVPVQLLTMYGRGCEKGTPALTWVYHGD